MPRVYFDTTVYDGIAKSEVPAQDLDELRPMIARHKIRAYPSLVDVEELLGQWETEPAEVIRRLRIMEDVVGLNPMLKPPADLLADEIRAYADGAGSPPPTLPPGVAARVAESLRQVIHGDSFRERQVAEIVADVKGLKDRSHTNFTEARRESLGQLNWDQLKHEDRKALKFEDYFASNLLFWADVFVKPLGPEILERCQRRGLEGLIKRRPVRLVIGATLSMIFAQIVGDGDQSRKARRGDGYDLWHALLASCADIFVTGDGALANQLRRVPMGDFRVATSIRELLDDPSLARSR